MSVWRGLPLPPLLSLRWVPEDQSAGVLAEHVANVLRHAIEQRGQAVLCVSGGKSPAALFDALSTCPLDWAKVKITLVDERCVAPDDPASNAGLVRRHLLQHAAKGATLIPLVQWFDAAQESLSKPLEAAGSASMTPNTHAARLNLWAQQADDAVQALGPADLVVLGMGADGHTASLFPGSSVLPLGLDEQGTRSCLPVPATDVPAAAPYERVTQTLVQLMRAREWVLPVSGADKLDVLQRALAQRNVDLPVSYFLHQTRVPMSLWMND